MGSEDAWKSELAGRASSRSLFSFWTASAVALTGWPLAGSLFVRGGFVVVSWTGLGGFTISYGGCTPLAGVCLAAFCSGYCLFPVVEFCRITLLIASCFRSCALVLYCLALPFIGAFFYSSAPSPLAIWLIPLWTRELEFLIITGGGTCGAVLSENRLSISWSFELIFASISDMLAAITLPPSLSWVLCRVCALCGIGCEGERRSVEALGEAEG
jgi:hypothetical protein